MQASIDIKLEHRARRVDFDTVAGFLIESFGHLPGVGDHIVVQNWRFEVVDLDGRRVDKVLASRPPVTTRGTTAS